MDDSKEYYAFISYKSEDVEWAIWLQHELEHYHLPASYNGRTDIRQELRPVFRDIDELSAGNLPEQIRRALENSQNLIVVCSPQAAASPWVNQEVETFISLGRTDCIFPFIVEGHPYANDEKEECFPEALRNLPPKEERLGGDATKQGRDMAFVKVVSGMLNVSFDSLWNRYEKEKAEEERKQREQRDNLLRVQSHYLAEKSMDVLQKGNSQLARLLALEALPKDSNLTDRPYVPAAEAALRTACESQSCIFSDPYISTCAVFSPDGKLIAFPIDNNVKIVDTATSVQIHLLQGHTDWIRYICFSHSSTLLASASIDNTVRIWDVTSGEIQKTIKGHLDIVTTVSFNADDSMIVTGSYDGTVRFWNVETGTEVMQLECPPKECDEGVHTYAYFSPNGQFIAVKYHNDIRSTPVYVWHHKTDNTGWEVLTTTGNDWPYEFAFSQDGKCFAFDNEDVSDKKIRIINLESNEEYAAFSTNKNVYNVFALAYSHDGQLIAYSGNDNNIYIIDSKSGEEVRCLEGHSDDIERLVFSPDDRLLLSSATDGTVRLWELYPKPGYMLKHNLRVTAVNSQKHLLAGHRRNWIVVHDFASENRPIIEKVTDAEYFRSTELIYDGNLAALCRSGKLVFASNTHDGKIVSPDGKYFLSSNYLGTTLYNKATGEAIVSGQYFNATFSLDGKWVLFSSWIYTDVWIYDIASRRKLRTFFPKPVRSAILSADKSRILFSDNNVFYSVSIESLCFDIEIDYAGTASFSPDSSILLLRSANDIAIVDLSNPFGTLWHKSFSDKAFVKSASFLSDSKAVQYTYTDGDNGWHVRQYSVGDGTESDILDFDYAEPPETSSQLSPDNSKIATLNHFDCYLQDIENDRILTLHHTRHINDAAFSPDGSLLATACCDQAVHLWDVATGEEINVLRGHRGFVNNVIFSPDGKYIISGSRDMDVRVWDAASGSCIQQFTGHTAEVIYICISEDGQYIASDQNSNKYNMLLWHLPSANELITKTRETHALRPLTKEERRQYHLETANDIVEKK